jgi:hypothetical protein
MVAGLQVPNQSSDENEKSFREEGAKNFNKNAKDLIRELLYTTQRSAEG